MNELRRLMEMREKQEISTAQMGQCIPYQPPTLKETLIDRRNCLRAELDRVEEALRLFETEPRVTDAIEIILKATR